VFDETSSLVILCEHVNLGRATQALVANGDFESVLRRSQLAVDGRVRRALFDSRFHIGFDPDRVDIDGSIGSEVGLKVFDAALKPLRGSAVLKQIIGAQHFGEVLERHPLFGLPEEFLAALARLFDLLV